MNVDPSHWLHLFKKKKHTVCIKHECGPISLATLVFKKHSRHIKHECGPISLATFVCFLNTQGAWTWTHLTGHAVHSRRQLLQPYSDMNSEHTVSMWPQRCGIQSSSFMVPKITSDGALRPQKPYSPLGMGQGMCQRGTVSALCQ